MSQDNRNRNQQDDEKTNRDRSTRESRGGSGMDPDINRDSSRQGDDAEVDDTDEMDDEDRDDDERVEGGQNRRRSIS